MSVNEKAAKKNAFTCIGIASIFLINISLGCYSFGQFLWFTLWGIGAGVLLHVARDFLMDAQKYRAEYASDQKRTEFKRIAAYN